MTTTISTEPAAPPDLAAIKSRQQAMWASGDFAVIGNTLQIVGETICEAVDLRAGERVLDVAAGNGNATLAAARRFAEVTSTDYVPALLDGGRRRADAEGFDIRFEFADAEALPYETASFDVVVSTFGVMFAPDHRRTASELLRVCRPGGRIGLANWTPAGFIGKLFRVSAGTSRRLPASSRRRLWGTPAHLRTLFGDVRIEHESRDFNFRYRSPEHFVEVFRTFYGPVHKAFAALDDAGKAGLEADMLALLRESDRGGAAGLVVPGEYLEVVITR
jgi:SAM-dependent methyltransferase